MEKYIRGFDCNFNSSECDTALRPLNMFRIIMTSNKNFGNTNTFRYLDFLICPEK